MPRNPAPRENTLDKAARELVLARDSIGCAAGMGRCQVCRKIMPHTELEASHHVGRRKRSVRWDADNISCKCHSCHRQMDLNPLEHAEWVKEWLGEERYDALKSKSNQLQKLTGKGKWELLAELRAEKRRICAANDLTA